jgi:hypothetical protein
VRLRVTTAGIDLSRRPSPTDHDARDRRTLMDNFRSARDRLEAAQRYSLRTSTSADGTARSGLQRRPRLSTGAAAQSCISSMHAVEPQLTRG